MERLRLGYYLNLRLEEQFIGGVLVTDSTGIPIEFKYTEPIKPTRIHQIIFGKVMARYINDEVIRKNLLKEIRNTPAFLLVMDLETLGEDQVSRMPMIAVQKTVLPALTGVGETQRVKDKEVLLQTATSSNPLRLTFFTPEPDVQEKVLNGIRSFVDKMDILEPFSRVEAALKTLCQNKS
jgi:hypothetical protein